jgi:hypothetical protein
VSEENSLRREGVRLRVSIGKWNCHSESKCETIKIELITKKETIQNQIELVFFSSLQLRCVVWCVWNLEAKSVEPTLNE